MATRYRRSMDDTIPPDSHGSYDRFDTWILVLFSSVYFLVTAILASRKVLWTDELVTIAIARAASLSDFWLAMVNGGDTLPPLSHFLTRLTTRVADGELGARLPALVGYWIMSVSIFSIVRRYADRQAALVACLFPAVTMAFAYAYEARPYALMLGFGALAVLSWDRQDRGNRFVCSAGLVAGVAGAIGTHWYGILLLPALCIGELIRTWKSQGTIDWQFWVTLLVATVTPVILLLPVIQHARDFSGAMSISGWVDVGAVSSAYQTLLTGSATTLLGLFAVVAWRADGSAAAASPTPHSTGLPSHLLACVLVLSSIPVWAIVLSSITGVYNVRYLLLTVVGISVGIGALLQSVLRCHPRRKYLATAIVLSGALFSVYEQKRGLLEVSSVREHEGIFSLFGCDGVVSSTNEPVVVSDVHTFYILHHYAPANLRGRLLHVTDGNAIAARMSNGMTAFADWRFVRYDELRRLGAFFLYEGQAFKAQAEPQLLSRLVTDGARIDNGRCAVSTGVYPRPGTVYRVETSTSEPARAGQRRTSDASGIMTFAGPSPARQTYRWF